MRFFKRLPYVVRIIVIATIVSLIVIICGALLMRFSAPNPPVRATTSSTPASVVSNISVSSSPANEPTSVSSTVSPADLPNNPPAEIKQANPVFVQQQPIATHLAYGHFPYAQADQNRLMIVSSYATGKYKRFEFMNPEAGKALMQMIYAAREEGVWIIPVSGFRTIEQQQKLFQNQIKRLGSEKEAAKVSAPAGYSEHHTGFAVDLADGKFPKQDITLEFERTDAYRWLTRRAKEFGFEMSFKRNYSQGVSFEPWHWRYVGTPDAVAIFASARNQQ
jgi:D-alanyl-D-alanine carboxypeptidase